MTDSLDLIIPAWKHRKLLTWTTKRKPCFRNKYTEWCEATIGEYGKDWQIVMIPQGQNPPHYVLRCKRIKAIAFKLKFL